MKQKLQDVRNFLEARKNAAADKLAKKAENKLTDEQVLDLKLHWCTQAIRDGENVMRTLMGSM